MKKQVALFIFLFTILTSSWAKDPSMHWLEGNWIGTGGAANSSFTWTITLSYIASENQIKLTYPSHSCGGSLKIISIETGNASCIEDLNYGLGSCSTGHKVTIKQELDGSITLNYFNLENAGIKSIAKLKRN